MPFYSREADHYGAVLRLAQLAVNSLSPPGPAGDPPRPAQPRAIPARILDLTNWKLTLPIDKAREVRQPALAGYEHPDFFCVKDGAVLFTAPAGGDPTSGSRYPRCELREMSQGGKAQAAWSTDTGTHIMTLTGACLATPPKKPQVVVAQVHDASDDLVEILCDGMARPGRHVVSLRWNGAKAPTYLDDDYSLGEPYQIAVICAQGLIAVEYTKGGVSRSLSESLAASGCYFKAGCYTQSRTAIGEDPAAIGQAAIAALKVVHR